MAVSIVVGGQYGSEGKGKVAHHLARERGARAVVRVGGSNSGHTSMGDTSQREVLRHLPTAALDPDVLCVLAPGSYVDLDVLFEEIERIGLPAHRLVIDPNAMIITAADLIAEQRGGLGERIGSTCSGTGAAVQRRISRHTTGELAGARLELAAYLQPVRPLLRQMLEDDARVIIEGTQGFGLSLLHTAHFPNATSRDTTAAGALSETGLSPLDVDEVVLVLRAFPIRVAGESGPFGAQEIDWATVALEGGHPGGLEERTSVTKRVRRVARFDPSVVREAITSNAPNIIVLNHVDHVDADAKTELTGHADAFVADVSEKIGRRIDLVGLGPDTLVPVRRSLRLPV
jgi:adenylosuccinate synthase